MTVVDAPVIFGILYSLYLAGHFFSPSVVSQVDTGAKAFDIGFRLGTLAMHLAISQFIFVGIYCWYAHYRYRLKHSKSSITI